MNTQDLLETGSGDGKVSLWNPNTGKLIAQRKEHADAIYCLSFAADGKRLATIGGDGKKGDTQGRIWSVPSLEVATVLPGHDRPAYGVLFGPRASKASAIVTSGGDKLIHYYANFTDQPRTLKGHTSDVYRRTVNSMLQPARNARYGFGTFRLEGPKYCSERKTRPTTSRIHAMAVCSLRLPMMGSCESGTPNPKRCCLK